MDSKTYAYLDRYAKLQPYSNFLLYAANHPFTPLSLRRKRVLSFLLKKLLKCCYSATTDRAIIEQALQILNYLLLTFDAETQKVEGQLVIQLEDIMLLIRKAVLAQQQDSQFQFSQQSRIFDYHEENSSKDDEMLNQFCNFLTQLSKKKQKYSNVFSYLLRVIGLMCLAEQPEMVGKYLTSQYSTVAEHMNNPKFTLLLNTCNALPGQFQFKQYKEKVLKEKNLTTDMLLDLAQKAQENNESPEDILKLLGQYKGSFNGADSFLVRRKYLELAYENGFQLEKDEVFELVSGDLFDLEYVKRVISYSEFFLDKPSDLILNIVMKVLEFSYGTCFIWQKLLKLLSMKKESHTNKKKNNQSLNNNNSTVVMEGEEEQEEEGDASNNSDMEENQDSVRGLSEEEISSLARLHYSGKYQYADTRVIKKRMRKNKKGERQQNNKKIDIHHSISHSVFSNNDDSSKRSGMDDDDDKGKEQLVECKQQVLEKLLELQKDNQILLKYQEIIGQEEKGSEQK